MTRQILHDGTDGLIKTWLNEFYARSRLRTFTPLGSAGNRAEVHAPKSANTDSSNQPPLLSNWFAVSSALMPKPFCCPSFETPQADTRRS